MKQKYFILKQSDSKRNNFVSFNFNDKHKPQQSNGEVDQQFNIFLFISFYHRL